MPCSAFSAHEKKLHFSVFSSVLLWVMVLCFKQWDCKCALLITCVPKAGRQPQERGKEMAPNSILQNTRKLHYRYGALAARMQQQQLPWSACVLGNHWGNLFIHFSLRQLLHDTIVNCLSFSPVPMEFERSLCWATFCGQFLFQSNYLEVCSAYGGFQKELRNRYKTFKRIKQIRFHPPLAIVQTHTMLANHGLLISLEAGVTYCLCMEN